MRLKTFQAPSMSEALQQIKETLGEHAIIVTTREDQSGWVRVTAAVEASVMKDALALEPAPQEPAEAAIDAITGALLKHRAPAAVSDKIISSAMTINGSDARKVLAKALARCFTFAPEDLMKKPLLLVGPPGAGKTLMAAKLAAQAVMDGDRPAVISTDIMRAGGTLQLEAFLNIMSLPLS